MPSGRQRSTYRHHLRHEQLAFDNSIKARSLPVHLIFSGALWRRRCASAYLAAIIDCDRLIFLRSAGGEDSMGEPSRHREIIAAKADYLYGKIRH